MCQMALDNDFFVFYMFSVFLKAEVNSDKKKKSVKLAIFMVVILFMVRSVCQRTILFVTIDKGYSLLILSA